MNSKRSALLIGASGLVGAYVKEEILQNSYYTHLTTFVRNYTNKVHPKLTEVKIDFENMSDYKEHFKVEDLFICLGTTKKKAGTKERFRKVDYDYVVEAAGLAKENGVTKIAVVSAIGADEHSRFFYNQVKGEMEQAVSAVGITSTYFFRPSLLLGDRNEFRLGERVGEVLGTAIQPLLRGKLQKYRSVHGQTVAKAMVRFLNDGRDGVHIVESDLIAKIGDL
ncbi:NAD(P)H-binding protein [Sutcliffiella horikoshii]|uniref:NAD(P)H-binding protein n=1 Tax=Sutcliffiella horikoshii TaxID=79883 RepID=A0A5D4THC5_9BACI|nr:NAD(P)H-binding protein [Sutcliffiella horikoshii]TYS73534.1 NAD(P)H-binding protein [Sutcliffiella horikoshii]